MPLSPDPRPSIHKIDLHYHAGFERQAGKTLLDHLEHARQTGRTCVGITDHVGLYMYPDAPVDEKVYPQSLEGLLQFKTDVENLKEDFPEVKFFFAPEYIRRPKLDEIPDAWFAMADYCICELYPDPEGGIEERTELAIDFIREVRRLSDRTGKPAYCAHPLRWVVNQRLHEAETIDSEIGEILQEAPGKISDEGLNRIFLCDFQELGRAACLDGIPLEINGGTQHRILSSRLPQVYPAYVQAYERMMAAGARFVPGSDQHWIDDYPKIANWYSPFDHLGIEALDLRFCQRLGIRFPDGLGIDPHCMASV